MVDRQARDMAAMVLRQFIDGSITNDEYERKFPRNKLDPALRAIYAEMWFYYSDLSEHTLVGEHALRNETLAFCERCFLFLNTNLEFEWPPPKYKLRYGIMRLVGLGWLLRRREERTMSIGDIEVWPFLKKADYQEAVSKYHEAGGPT